LSRLRWNAAAEIASALWDNGVDDLKLDHPAAHTPPAPSLHTRNVDLMSGDLANEVRISCDKVGTNHFSDA
jgi:hypothetical protein